MQAQIKIMLSRGTQYAGLLGYFGFRVEPYGSILAPTRSYRAKPAIGWEDKLGLLRQEVYGKGTTAKQIGQEVGPEIRYVKFWRVFREQVGRQASPEQVTIRLHHNPAAKTQNRFL